MTIYDSNEAEVEKEVEAEAETETESPVEKAATTAAVPKIEKPEIDSNYEELKNQIRGLQQGIQAERQKRQEAEAKPKPGLFDNPEAWEKELTTRIENMTIKNKIDMSESYARERFPDYQEVEEHFISIATPEIIQAMRNHPDPAGYAYKIGKTHRDLQGIGNIEEFKEKIRQETIKELEAKKGNLDKSEKLKKLPDSLSTLTAAADETPFVQKTAEQLYNRS
jgi:hypothetical protein